MSLKGVAGRRVRGCPFSASMKQSTKDFFKDVKKKGSLRQTEHLSFKFLPAGRGDVRVVISKKIISRAVTRNLLKRRILNLYKRLLELKEDGSQGVFFVKKGADSLPLSVLREEVMSLMRAKGKS